MTIRQPELEDVIEQLIEQRVAQIHVSLPGRVESFNPDDNTVDVKPLIQRPLILQDGTDLAEALPVITAVPVRYPRGAGDQFALVWPLAQGDFVQLIFCERSIDLWLSGDGSDTDPVDLRKHDLSDAVAVPGLTPISQATPVEPDRVEMRFGATSIGVGDGVIDLGEKDAGDQAVLESKLQAELGKIQAQIDSIGIDLTSLAAHTHVSAAPGSPTGPPTPPPAGGQSYSPAATNSALVNISE